MPLASIEDIKARLGQEIGTSDWIAVPQSAINTFADVTGDHQFIHVDEEMAKQTPFGGTIAHGFLTLSLLSQMASGVMMVPPTTKMGVNYGFDRVRFLAPVRAGKRVRGRFVLASFEEKGPGRYQFVHEVTVEIEGEDKPALMAAWIGQVFA